MREQAGALEFDTIEATPVAKDGKVESLAVTRKNRARDLIEDFMIAANVAIARILAERNRSAIRRVVRVPRRWDRIVDIAKEYGFTLPAQPDAPSLSKFLGARRAADPLRFPDLSLSIVKLLGPGRVRARQARSERRPAALRARRARLHARHRAEPALRRSRDAAAREGGASPTRRRRTPTTSSRRSRSSAPSARTRRIASSASTRKAAAAELLAHRIGSVFDAIVTGVNKDGTYVRLLSPPAEGRVMRGEQGMDVGERVRVRLIRTDPVKGHIDFERREWRARRVITPRCGRSRRSRARCAIGSASIIALTSAPSLRTRRS